MYSIYTFGFCPFFIKKENMKKITHQSNNFQLRIIQLSCFNKRKCPVQSRLAKIHFFSKRDAQQLGQYFILSSWKGDVGVKMPFNSN